MSESIITLKGIEKKYGKHKVLNNVNLDIKKGDLFGLVGKNGSGKTTIFKIILGLSQSSRGSVELFGSDKNLLEMRKKIGFLIGSNFFSYMTAKQNLEYYSQLKGIKDKNEVDRVLEIVELNGVKSKFKSYSMGMKQRLGIANALLGNPEILILDEPTNGLDPQGIASIRVLVQKLNKEYGMTVIISSHILSELQNTASKFAIINDGTVARTVTQEELATTGSVMRVTVDDIEKARKALDDAGVQILKESKESQSLEDLYLVLLGGQKNV